MHFGIHGKTAAEIIASRANSKKPNMGITCISQNNLKKSDIFVAKNYLTQKEILQHKGKISKDLANKIAEDEYQIFKQNLLKNYESDFDKMVKEFETNGGK